MRTPINIHITSVERLYSDGLLTDKEYKIIMERIIAQRVKERVDGDSNG